MKRVEPGDEEEASLQLETHAEAPVCDVFTDIVLLVKRSF